MQTIPLQEFQAVQSACENFRAENTRLRATIKLALDRLGKLNRDDESGIRIVLANALVDACTIKSTGATAAIK